MALGPVDHRVKKIGQTEADENRRKDVAQIIGQKKCDDCESKREKVPDRGDFPEMATMPGLYLQAIATGDSFSPSIHDWSGRAHRPGALWLAHTRHRSDSVAGAASALVVHVPPVHLHFGGDLCKPSPNAVCPEAAAGFRCYGDAVAAECPCHKH
jgi:hypothetical protein